MFDFIDNNKTCVMHICISFIITDVFRFVKQTATMIYVYELYVLADLNKKKNIYILQIKKSTTFVPDY